jgi:hypothetical protein
MIAGKSAIEWPSCPKCGNAYVRLSLRENAITRLLQIIQIYQFRCQLCKGRFMRLRWGRVYPKPILDQREYERVPVQLPVTFFGDKTHGKGTIANLSMDGCVIETSTPLKEGELMSLLVHLADARESLEVEVALVRWSFERRRGLEFVHLQPNHEEGLRRFLMSCWEDPAATATSESPPIVA